MTTASDTIFDDQPLIEMQLTNLGVRALVEYCKSTLTSIDLSDCTGLNDEVHLPFSLARLLLFTQATPASRPGACHRDDE